MVAEFIAKCPCGTAQLAISADPVAQFYCHCSDCRAVHGGAYAPEALYPAHAVAVRGETIRFALKTTERVSCASCGARLYADLPRAGLKGINGTLLPAFRAEFHMHCSEAVLPVVDDLPHYASKPAAFGGEDALADW